MTYIKIHICQNKCPNLMSYICLKSTLMWSFKCEPKCYFTPWPNMLKWGCYLNFQTKFDILCFTFGLLDFTFEKGNFKYGMLYPHLDLSQMWPKCGIWPQNPPTDASSFLIIAVNYGYIEHNIIASELLRSLRVTLLLL